ncbi:DUF2254 domain-containing protein [Deinococcus aestuarii]|uniref:DUF2254 domain-containing protein n=1 Tax=Deinococcus aestuarii TaxID=2774531 RepID=UPI001C0D940C|nr:DUF2254 domain-containing protein [Deinococcus aestuarii]
MNRTWLHLREVTRRFWFLPALMVAAALLLAEGGITLEERHGVPQSLAFIYGGGEAGARSMLSAVASSSVAVAGTVFSITIAALSFAAGSMGPRLLDNFTRDRGNQVTLGTFIATFAFCVYSLRVVQGGEEVPFVPHYNVTLAVVLALGCIAVLVYFIFHVTASINMTHVLNLLRDDLNKTLKQATREGGEPPDGPVAPPERFWEGAETLRAPEGGYLQLVDTGRLLDRAEREDVAVRLLVRPGDYVFPETVVALGVPRLPEGVLDALSLGNQRLADQDAEHTLRQMAEVAARALSSGVNDPYTAVDVLDRFGDALCRLRGRTWPTGVYGRGGRPRLVHPVTDFAGLTDAMFRMVRQYGKANPAVMIRLLEVLTAAATCLTGEAERAALRRQADLTLADALPVTGNPADRADLERRFRKFGEVLSGYASPSRLSPEREEGRGEGGELRPAQG